MMETVIPAPPRPKARRRKGTDARVGTVSYLPAGARELFVGGDPRLRVLVVFEFQYRAYGEAIAGAIRKLRPRVEVVVAGPPALKAEVARTSPHLVISSQPNTADSAHTPAWVELPHEPGLAGTICFGGQCLKTYDLALGDLLAVVDRAEGLVRAKPDQ